MEEDIRVVIADDDPSILALVRFALERGGCQVVGEGGTADQAIDLVAELVPEVALLDIHMPGNGIRAAAAIAAAQPGVSVVMLTSSEHDDDLLDALRAGALGYLLKGADPSSLAPALRGVLEGEAALPPRLVTRVIEAFRAPDRLRRDVPGVPGTARLTTREWEVMELLGSGASTAEVARRLFLSPTTVRVHVSTVIRKLHVPDREAAIEALRLRSED